MIRIVLCMIFVVLFLILAIPVGFVFFLIGCFDQNKKDMLSMRLIKWAFSVLLVLAGTKLTVIGEEKIPRDEPVLYVGNHRSYFDIVSTDTRAFRPTGYIAKKELKKVPLLSWWMANIRCEFLDRSDLKKSLETILTCIKNVKEEKISYFIFPEGTRNDGEEGTLLPFHEGSFKIAEKSGCPIVPVAISGTREILEAHFPRITPTRVIIEYCDPIDMKSLSKEDKKVLGKKVHDIIEQKLKEHSL